MLDILRLGRRILKSQTRSAEIGIGLRGTGTEEKALAVATPAVRTLILVAPLTDFSNEPDMMRDLLPGVETTATPGSRVGAEDTSLTIVDRRGGRTVEEADEVMLGLHRAANWGLET